MLVIPAIAVTALATLTGLFQSDVAYSKTNATTLLNTTDVSTVPVSNHGALDGLIVHWIESTSLFSGCNELAYRRRTR
ncbi:hypothetical protein SPRG_02024 [Saprolegnia parasitica CBS 223.65]|uniref:Uncharacterized protein n=1 Tax=Saprolegnia parasitica (strain CBS 223.65) TaxID=695850 RepID=A0A067CRB5_SAPPC|nr:hypothetical protein SPRG_02024 [Saprolegnia parasitica CBS 223.65]KDO33214.1 hypothetical protein SPRG_02024 [Saprolegnia parasitica CBS 223.65]|eukprot:XP_012195971.1 hypothetical protein SPRG_02024 [Saprolegnia parasitica CBS 223.65]